MLVVIMLTNQIGFHLRKKIRIETFEVCAFLLCLSVYVCHTQTHLPQTQRECLGCGGPRARCGVPQEPGSVLDLSCGRPGNVPTPHHTPIAAENRLSHWP